MNSKRERERQARVEDIRWLAETGCTLPDAALRLGLSATTLERFCTRWGLSAEYQRMKHRGHHCDHHCEEALRRLSA